MRFGVWEVALILLLVVILFGSAKIPQMMRNLAGGIKTFKKEIKDDDAKEVEPTKKEPVKKVSAKRRAVKKTAVKRKPVKKK